jgi:hypothetical protein
MSYITKKEAAAKIRRHPATVMRLVQHGVISPPLRLTPGGPVLFDEQIFAADIRRLQEAQRQTAAEAS